MNVKTPRVVAILTLLTLSHLSQCYSIRSNSKKPPPVFTWSRQMSSLVASKRLPFPMGIIPSGKAAYLSHSHFVIDLVSAAKRPIRFSIARLLPPIGDQKTQKSCVAWSAAYYVYTYAMARRMNAPFDEKLTSNSIFSPAFLYHLGNNGRDKGMQISRSYDLLQTYGCASLGQMPYEPSDITSLPSKEVLRVARNFKAERVGSLFMGRLYGKPAPKSEALKIFLAETQMPFSIGVPIFKDFPTKAVKAGTVYRLHVLPNRRNFRGLHALTVIGYDDTKHAFQTVNSLGRPWGEGGLLWIDEKFVTEWAFDGWTCVAGGPSPRTGLAEDERFAPHVQLSPPMLNMKPTK